MSPSAPKLKVLHRDAHFLAVHKPAGLPTYRESRGRGMDGCKETLEEQLNQRLFPVHRIDADTSGLVLFALDPRSAAALIRLFQEHRVRKVYEAWCVGQTPARGTISTPLRKNKGGGTESARTDFERVRVRGPFSLLRVFPHTGRFHQIRRHLESIGHPLVGDPLYGGKDAWISFFQGSPRLMLQASELEFDHPVHRKTIRIRTREPLEPARP